MTYMDPMSNSDGGIAISPQSVAAAASADGVDISNDGKSRWLIFTMLNGDLGSGTVTYSVEEADDDGSGSADTYAAVTGATAVEASDDTREQGALDLQKRKAWVRITVDNVGGTGALIGVAYRKLNLSDPTAAQLAVAAGSNWAFGPTSSNAL